MLQKNICKQCWCEVMRAGSWDDAGLDSLWDENGQCQCAFLMCASEFYMLKTTDTPPLRCIFRVEQLLNSE